MANIGILWDTIWNRHECLFLFNQMMTSKKTPSLSWMPPVSLSSPRPKQTPSQIKASKVELEEHYIPILGDIFLSFKPILPSFLDLLL